MHDANCGIKGKIFGVKDNHIGSENTKKRIKIDV